MSVVAGKSLEVVGDFVLPVSVSLPTVPRVDSGNVPVRSIAVPSLNRSVSTAAVA